MTNTTMQQNIMDVFQRRDKQLMRHILLKPQMLKNKDLTFS